MRARNPLPASSSTRRIWSRSALLAFIAAAFVASGQADTYLEWKTRVFSEAEQADPAISSETALSPAGDGIPNLLKYALGIDPHLNGLLALPAIDSIQAIDPLSGLPATYPALRHRVSSTNPPSDLYFVPEISFDLQTWARGDAVFVAPSTGSTGNPGDPVIVTYRAIQALNNGAVFLRLRVLEGESLPEDWQTANFGHTGVDPNADPDGDGRSTFEEFLHGTDPNDYYNGAIPELTIVSGNGQRGFPSHFLPFPLVVRVTNGGAALVNAPVRFSIAQGSAQISATSERPAQTAIDLRADANGIAAVYGFLGETHSETSVIDARATGQAVSFVETSLAGISAKVAAGDYFSLALDENGTLWVWGRNSSGQLGDGTFESRAIPFQNPYLNQVIDVAGASGHGVALKVDGTVWTWGSNGNGQLGDGTDADHSVPAQVPYFEGAIAVSAGLTHTIALRADGTVWAWGYNGDGELGNAGSDDSYLPVEVVTESGEPLRGVVAIDSGYYHNLAVKSDGTVWAWGANWNGAIGDGTNVDRHFAVQVPAVSGVSVVKAGAYHSLALSPATAAQPLAKTSDRHRVPGNQGPSTVWAWGANFFAQLANETYEDSNVPLVIPSLQDVIDLASGFTHNLALASDGVVWGWGSNSSGEASGEFGPPVTNPVAVPGLASIISVAAGSSHSLALATNGLIYAWGENGAGQLGIGSGQSQSAPVPTAKDTYHTGVPDAWQLEHFGHLGVNGSDDADGDGLSNAEEYASGTDPVNGDTDHDGLSDGKDGWPLDPDITLPRSPEYHYAIIAVGAFFPASINNKGMVVGGASCWDNGMLHQLQPLLGFDAGNAAIASANGVNDDGVICGTSVYHNELGSDNPDASASFNVHACKWSNPAELPIDIGDLTVDDGINEEAPVPPRSENDEHGYVTPNGTNHACSYGNAINAAGEIVGSSHTYADVHKYYPWVMSVQAFDRQASKWTSKGNARLGMLATPNQSRTLPNVWQSEAHAISNDGVVVGASSTDFLDQNNYKVPHAFKSDGSGMVDLGTLGGNISSAEAVSGSGQIVGYSEYIPSDPLHNVGAFVVSPARPMKSLTKTPGGFALGVNNLGQVVGGSGNGTAIIWRNGKATALISLTAGDGQLQYASAIAENGSIACYGAFARYPGSTAFLLLPVELVVDANRDGVIKFADNFDDPELAGHALDETSEGTPYRFWLNDDDDTEIDSIETEKVPAPRPDYSLHQIVSKRNLEDFARLWIYFGALHESIKAGKIKVGLRWRTVTPGTNPAVNLYPSADGEGSDDYLKDDAAAQAQIAGNFNNAVRDISNVQTIGPNDLFVFKDDYWNGLSVDNPKKCFLFEGAGEGKGELEIVFFDQDYNEIGRGGSLWLDLKNVKRMYQGIESASEHPWQHLRFDRDPNEDPTTATVFVHGWRMSPDGAANFAETMFKRLWHRGYKGRFAAFHWDTWWYGGAEWLPYAGEAIDAYLAHYNDSEYIAWNAAPLLKSFVDSLPFANKNIIAHSMGNIVASEALREGMVVKNYALLNAAVPAACYDEDESRIRQNTQYIQSAGPFSFTMWDSPSPDGDSDPTTRDLAYRGTFQAIGTRANLVNCYLPDDNATSFAWEVNNDQTKPPVSQDGIINAILDFNFEYDPNEQAGHKLWKFAISPDHPSYYIEDKTEAMAYACRTWGKAVGAFGSTAGSINAQSAVNLRASVFGLPNGFDTEHSAEFDRGIQQLKAFYDRLMDELRLNKNP